MAPVPVGFGYAAGVDPRLYGMTCTRADATTCARYRDANGLWQVVAADVPRYLHYQVNGIVTLLREGAATNLLTYGRDLTNAAWTASNVTVAATTGADGVANSGSRLTATAGNGTVIRAAALVHASAAYAGSFIAKRITGTGNIDLTLDNGATWTTVTLTSAYTQLFTTQTLANSQFGIRLVTSGDVIDVDFCQDETGAVPSSPIGTAAAAVTRAADLISAPWTRNPEAGTWYVDAYDLKAPALSTYTLEIRGANGGVPAMLLHRPSVFRSTTTMAAGTSISSAAATPSLGDRVELRNVLAVSGGNITSTLGQSINAATEAVAATGTARALDVAWDGAAKLSIGNSYGGGSGSNLAIRSLCYVPGPETSMAVMRTLSPPSIVTRTNTLSPISLTAERSWFGQPMFTVKDTGTGTLLSASATPRADQLVRIFKLNVSFSISPNAIPIWIYDGDSTIIWQGMTSATGRYVYHFDFSKKPLRGSRGNVVYVITGSGGAANVGTVSFDGDFVRAP